jgi:ion channel-forming bestrophin family protein
VLLGQIRFINCFIPRFSSLKLEVDRRMKSLVSKTAATLLLLAFSSTTAVLGSVRPPSATISKTAKPTKTFTPGQFGVSTVVPSENALKRDDIASRRPSVDAGYRYSSNDWLLNFLLIPKSFILKRIRFHLLSNIVCSILVIMLHEKFPKLSIPMTGHSLVASSLGLLLSYRTNSAYSRFWEARGHWTSTKIICRNLAVIMKTHFAPYSPKSSAKFIDQLAAFPSCLMHLCLGGAAKLSTNAQQWLPTDYDYHTQPAWPCMLLCMELQKTLHEAELESKTAKWNLIESAHHAQAAHQIESLLGQMSNCEKILRTPVPWTYSRHTSRFLTLWLGTLPLALIGTVSKWLILPIMISTGYCMLGIEEIGHLIEQPFIGDPLNGDDKIFVELDEDGEASEIITRGLKTMPYDIGIPVCSLAAQIRKEVEQIAKIDVGQSHHSGYSPPSAAAKRFM